jgi:hypothetical protein
MEKARSNGKGTGREIGTLLRVQARVEKTRVKKEAEEKANFQES